MHHIPKPMLAYCQLDTLKNWVKFESEFTHFHSSKCVWKFRLPAWQPFCLGGDELTKYNQTSHRWVFWPNLLKSTLLNKSLKAVTGVTLQWLHNERDCVTNHQSHDCLLNRLFRRWSKKTSKLWATGFCVGNSPVTGEFPKQKAIKAENVSIWWRHHEN